MMRILHQQASFLEMCSKASKFELAFILVYFFICHTWGASTSLKYTIPKLEGCQLIGFPNATINECGYCVGEGTSLSEDYGKDCKGICFGDAQYDCTGQCNGLSYLDECSGICIDVSSSSSSLGQREVNGSISRDCRGLCIPPELSRPQQQAYDRDECGICRLQSSERSPFIDCNGICQLPGLEKASLVCNECIDQNTTSLWQVVDECGNCRSERKYCSCDKEPSICGCNDPNSCYNIRSLIPSAVPYNVTSKILLSGYFHPVIKDLYCLLRHKSTREIISFPVSFTLKNKTAIECSVNLYQDGIYTLVLATNNGQRIFTKDSVELLVYDKDKISLTSMNPIEVLTTDSNSPLKLQFTDLSRTMPLLPLRCKITYSDKNEEVSMPGSTSEPLTCIFNPSSSRSVSQHVTIDPSFDGINSLSQTFSLTIKAPLPTISNQFCYISEDGLAVIIIFERPIDNRVPQSSNATSICEYFLTPTTLRYLNKYQIHDCVLATKIQLIVYVEIPITENAVTLKFNKRSIKESDQKIAQDNEKEMEITVKKLSSEPSWWSFEPVIAITGPSEVPQCGSFALIGHFSSPRGTHNVQFQWDVARDGGEVSVELKQYLENNGKSTNLLLISPMFEPHIPYKFFFKAYLPDSEQTLVVGHTLLRLNYDSPLVSIYHTTLLQTKPLNEDEGVTLVAEVSLPECVHPVQRVAIFWKVSDPRILFPLKEEKKRSSIIYEIKPYTVPVDVPVGFYLNAFTGFRFNETSGAGFSLIVRKAPLKAVIANGSPKITIGSKSGLFKLTSEGSSNGRSKKLVYQWSCHDGKTAQPCYFNFASLKSLDRYKKRDALLISKSMRQQSTLHLDSAMFNPNQQYWFGLQVFDINNNSRASETEYVLVKVTEGNAPQVYIGPVYVKSDNLVTYNPRFSAVVVPAFTPVTIKGIVKPASKMALLKWEVAHSTFPLNWNHKIVNDEIHTELKLHQNHLIPYGDYLIKLNACNTDGMCSQADIALKTPQGVSMCQVVVEPFVEYDLTAAFVQSCNTPPGYAPLTYQIFYADESLDHPIPVTMPQFSSVLTFPGTPLAAAQNNQITRFAASVCDRFENCQMFYSLPVNIEKAENESSSIDYLVKVANRYHIAGDSLAALGVFASVLTHPEESFTPLYEKIVNDTIKFAVEALKNPAQTLTEGHVSLAYFVLSSAVKKTNKTLLKSKLFATIQRITQKSKALQKMPQMKTLKSLYPIITSAFVRSEEEKRLNIAKPAELLLDIRNTFNEMREVAASQVQLGSVERFGRESEEDDGRTHNAVTLIVHDFKVHDVNVIARMGEDQVVEAKISFGEEVKRQFNPPWDCGQEMLCQSVVFTVTIYPDENPYPSLEYSYKISPIIDITIHAPNTGKEFHVKGLLKAASFFVTITGNETAGAPDYVTRCLFYDEAVQKWRPDGIHWLGIEHQTTGCWAGHMTSFVVLRINEGLNADNVIAVSVAVIMGILVLAMMVVFYMQKKNSSENAKVSPAPKVESPVKKPVQYVRKHNLNNQNIKNGASNGNQMEERRIEYNRSR